MVVNIDLIQSLMQYFFDDCIDAIHESYKILSLTIQTVV